MAGGDLFDLTDRAVASFALAHHRGSLPWSYEMITNDRGRIALVLVDLGCPPCGRRLSRVGRLNWTWLKRWWANRSRSRLRGDRQPGHFSPPERPQDRCAVAYNHLLAVVIAWSAVRSIAAAGTFEQLFLLTPPIMLLTMVTISIAGWACAKHTMMVAFGYAGLAQSDGTVVSILFGATYFIVGALGGLVWVFSAEKASGTIEVAHAED